MEEIAVLRGEPLLLGDDLFEIMDILAQLQRDMGTTLILILHDFPMALQYANNALLMQNGHICHYGPCREVLTSDIIKPTFHLDERFVIDTEGNIRRVENGELKFKIQNSKNKEQIQ